MNMETFSKPLARIIELTILLERLMNLNNLTLRTKINKILMMKKMFKISKLMSDLYS